MAKIYNSELSKELVEGAKLQQSHDRVPQELAEKVVPVIEVNPNMLKKQIVLGFKVKVTTGSQTIITTSSTKDTYLTGIHFGVVKDATCDIATGQVSLIATPEETNQSVDIVAIPVLTLTAQDQNVFLDFKRPIKLAQGTVIAMENDSYAAGLMSRHAVIYGYMESNPDA